MLEKPQKIPLFQKSIRTGRKGGRKKAFFYSRTTWVARERKGGKDLEQCRADGEKGAARLGGGGNQKKAHTPTRNPQGEQ